MKTNERADSEFIKDLVYLQQFELASELREKLENLRRNLTVMKDKVKELEEKCQDEYDRGYRNAQEDDYGDEYMTSDYKPKKSMVMAKMIKTECLLENKGDKLND